MWQQRGRYAAAVQGCIFGGILLALVVFVGGWVGLIVGGVVRGIER